MTALVLMVMALLTGASAQAQTTDLPRGRIVDAVACAGDATQSYALYLPSDYTPTRAWPLLMGFHPSARGRAIVETYQAAAEQYGYIVVASNNSRNGSWESSSKAVSAMTGDVGRRFSIAPGRFYMTGLSGGSRVALQVALASGKVNGVIASAAGYPDSQPRKSVPFLVFGTAGTEDFNYIEMKMLGLELKSPHRVVIFEGGHSLPPAPVALQAIEWLEVQAMAAGTRDRNIPLIEQLYAKGLAAAEHEPTPAAQADALDALATDFAKLKDVTTLRARVDGLLKDKDIKRALSQQRNGDYAEARLMNELMELEGGIFDEATRPQSLLRIREKLTQAHKRATQPDDSPERQQARRVIRAITSGASERLQDAEYLRLLDSFRLPGTGRGRGGA